MKTTKTTNEEKFDLQEAFVLWRKESKGIVYYTVYDLNKNNMVAFENTKKKNDKEETETTSTTTPSTTPSQTENDNYCDYCGSKLPDNR